MSSSRKKKYSEDPQYSRLGENERHAQVPEPIEQGHLENEMITNNSTLPINFPPFLQTYNNH